MERRAGQALPGRTDIGPRLICIQPAAAGRSNDETAMGMCNRLSRSQQKAFVAAYALMVAAALALIWEHRFLPMQDYPIWVSEGAVLSHCLRGEASSNFSIVPYPVPNAASTAVIGLLGLMMNVETAGKVFLSLAVAVFAAGGYWLTVPPSGLRRNAFSLMPLAWMVGYPFFHGNINYFLGLGLLMLGGGYLTRCADVGGSVRSLPMLALSVAMFFAHALVLAAWAVLLAAYLAGHRGRGWKAAALAHFPAMVLLAIYLVGRAAWPVVPLYGAPAPVNSATLWAKNKVTELLYYLCPFGQFHSFLAGPWPVAMGVANAVFLLLLAAVAVVVVRRTHRDGQDRWILAACGVCMLGWVLAPLYLAGVASPGQRLVLPAALLVSALAARRPWGDGTRAIAMGLAAGLLIFTVAYLLAHVGGISGRLADRYARLQRLDLSGDCSFIDEGLFGFKGRLPPCRRQAIWRKVLLPEHSVLGRLNYYSSLQSRGGWAVFGTSILQARRNPPVPCTLGELLQNAPERLVLLGCDEGNALLAADLSEKYRLCGHEANIAVMERIPARTVPASCPIPPGTASSCGVSPKP